jgi:hypothetical protein
MVDLERCVNALLLERQDLVNKIDAVDRALAAIRNTALSSATAAGVPEPARRIPEVTRVRAKRVLSEAHKRALVEGRRKAKVAREAAVGRALDSLESPAIAAPIDGAPRLVKRVIPRELTIEPDADTIGAL